MGIQSRGSTYNGLTDHRRDFNRFATMLTGKFSPEKDHQFESIPFEPHFVYSS